MTKHTPFLSIDDLYAIVKPHNDKLIAEGRLATAERRNVDLRKALDAACGYLLNAKIDLETGCTKATAIKTIEGGLKMIRAALAEGEGI